jgi:hypothetical protein
MKTKNVISLVMLALLIVPTIDETAIAVAQKSTVTAPPQVSAPQVPVPVNTTPTRIITVEQIPTGIKTTTVEKTPTGGTITTWRICRNVSPIPVINQLPLSGSQNNIVMYGTPAYTQGGMSQRLIVQSTSQKKGSPVEIKDNYIYWCQQVEVNCPCPPFICKTIGTTSPPSDCNWQSVPKEEYEKTKKDQKKWARKNSENSAEYRRQQSNYEKQSIKISRTTSKKMTKDGS